MAWRSCSWIGAAERMGLALRADDPGHRREPHVQRVGGIGNLRLRDVHRRPGHVVQAAVARVADHADNRAIGIRAELAHAAADGEPLVQRIALRPVLLRERFVDDDHAGRAAVVEIRERAPALHGDLEDLEVAGRHRHPAAAAMSGPLRRPADDEEPEAVAALQRHAARGARVHHARNGAQALDAVAHRLLDPRGCLKARRRQRHPHRQHVRRVEAGIDPAERDGRANQQRGTDQENQGQRDFRDDQHRPRLVLPEAGARSPAALLERGREVRLRALQRRDEPEEDARAEGDDDGERGDAPVEPDERTVRADARQVRGVDGEERPDAEDPQQQAEHAAGGREHDAFREQLTHDPPADPPTAARIAISRRRPVARARRRFATLAHAISRTKLTAPASTRSDRRTFRTSRSRTGSTLKLLSALIASGYFALYSAADASSRAFA